MMNPAMPDTPMTDSKNSPHLIPRLVSTSDSDGEPTAPLAACASGPASADVPAPADPPRGNLEDDYRVDTRVLGTGHHGSVRACVHRATGRRRAVKSIGKRDPAVPPGGAAREAALLRAVGDDAIDSVVRLVDAYEDDDYVHLVTELLEGGELFDRICERTSRRGPGDPPCFHEEEAARVLGQVLRAVAHLHARGIAHRDLKPENVLFETAEEDSPIKLIDFGLSRRHDPARQRPMRSVVGTPYYIAPEVLRKSYDGACDLWSLGVIAYILLCGYPPFNGADDRRTHRAVLRGRYHFLEEDWSAVSAEARDFVARLLRVDPRRRMTAAQALNHPWLACRTDAAELMATSEDVLDNSSVEVLYSVAPRAPRPAACGGSLMRSPRRGPTWKVRTSTFSF